MTSHHDLWIQTLGPQAVFSTVECLVLFSLCAWDLSDFHGSVLPALLMCN